MSKERAWLHYGINPILFMALVSWGFLTLTRLGLTLWQWGLVPEGGLSSIFLGGLRVDIASICGLYALPLLVITIITLLPKVTVGPVLIRILSAYCAAALAFLVMNEAATPSFVLEYGVRPNHIYVQYLVYPREVFSMLWHGHKLSLILGIALTLATLVAGYRLARWAFTGYRSSGRIAASVMLLATLALVPLGIRSSLGHRPLNPAMVAFCDNSLINSLALNSSYSAVYALAHLGESKLGAEHIFQRIANDAALSVLPEFSARTATATTECPLNQALTPWSTLQSSSPVPAGHSALHSQTTTGPYNLVIILEESLGDNFAASQGGWPLTPNFDQLREQGWYFDNMFAAGHRSIRGIEAVTASMPPSPLPSIVDLPFGAEPYATIFELCELAGYDTSFIYGGESHFDNMRDYFFSNGMKKVIEQVDYPNPSFVASWGVSDEDLFARANEEFKQSFAAGKPFCSVVFSSSFHDPFDIPAGKVSITDEEYAAMKATARDDYEAMPERLLAAKYADYALGKFFEQAQQEEYFDHTIFLVIADHESRVSGAETFPFNDFTIPAVILAPNVGPYIDQRVVSQIDMGMTLMSLMGFVGEVPNVGQNLLRSDIIERAPMQFNYLFGYYDRSREEFIQLPPMREPSIWQIKDHTNLTQSRPLISPEDQILLERAIKILNLGPAIYESQWMTRSCIKLQPPQAPTQPTKP